MAYNPTDVYQQVGVETRAASATPHALILMLFDGGLAALASARLHMLRGNILQKGAAITRTIAILEELNASLNMQAGGYISRDLRALYLYMMQRLLRANLDNDVKCLDEVRQLLGNLRTGWAAMGR